MNYKNKKKEFESQFALLQHEIDRKQQTIVDLQSRLSHTENQNKLERKNLKISLNEENENHKDKMDELLHQIHLLNVEKPKNIREK